MKKFSIILLSCMLLLGGALAAENEVNGREDNQNARISNGVADGQLSKGQAHNLHHNENKIHREVKRDRRANGGHLTKAEHRQVNRQLNHESHKIPEERHDK